MTRPTAKTYSLLVFFLMAVTFCLSQEKKVDSIQANPNIKTSIPLNIRRTANVLKEVVEKCYEAGMNCFIGNLPRWKH